MSHLLIRGDSRRIPLADNSVHMVVTSPPYFGLRDYGTAGQIGLESTPDEFVAAMVRVFREVRRVLRPDGTLWLNLGDSFNSAGTANKNGSGASGLKRDGRSEAGRTKTNAGTADQMRLAGTGKKLLPDLKPKDLIGVPWRVAFALQADGWYLRSDIIWHKPNPMPESVRDRPTKSHEYLFLLAKSPRYYFDADAVKEPNQLSSTGWANCKASVKVSGNGETSQKDAPGSTHRMGSIESGRNLRSVWTIPTEAYPGAHFATFPRKLVRPCILAGTSAKGCCPVCGAGWVRVVERVGMPRDRSGVSGSAPLQRSSGDQFVSGISTFGGRDLAAWKAANPDRFLGWRPACDCPDHEPVPCVVLDPFNGSGTTGLVAESLGRNYVGLDLSAEYLAQARDRITRPHKKARASKPRDKSMPLFKGIR